MWFMVVKLHEIYGKKDNFPNISKHVFTYALWYLLYTEIITGKNSFSYYLSDSYEIFQDDVILFNLK
jgi:hypothetical protein